MTLSDGSGVPLDSGSAKILKMPKCLMCLWESDVTADPINPLIKVRWAEYKGKKNDKPHGSLCYYCSRIRSRHEFIGHSLKKIIGTKALYDSFLLEKHNFMATLVTSSQRPRRRPNVYGH